MSQASHSLSARRLELLRQIAIQRQQLRGHAEGIQSIFGNLASEFSPARWLGASPRLLAGAVVLMLVLGRGRVLRTLGTGAALVGLLRRYRTTFQVFGQLVTDLLNDQTVRRSR